MVADTLAKTALSRFYQHSVNKSNWEIFREKGYTRIAYIGTSLSNLAKLVDEEATFCCTQNTSLHLPFPSVRPTLPWKPTTTMPSIEWYSSSFVDDMSALPSHEVRDDLVDSFFTKIHPGFPIVDESEFRSQYNDPGNPPPLLLLQAVLLAGAHVSQHPNIVCHRARVKQVIFRRAKALFDLHYENDRMYVVQAALLFMWYVEGADDICSNVYYWTGIACRVAYGLGMHRDLAPELPILMPVADPKIYRRIWWTLFQVETLSSLHHGRPSMIDLDEVDQSPLQIADFIEQDGRLNQNINIDYCIQNAELCNIIIGIIKLSSPGAVRRYSATPELFQASQGDINQKLVSWYLSLPANLGGPTDSSQPTAFWALQLRLHYNLALLHLHRLPEKSFPRVDLVQGQISNDICQTAATAISKLFADLLTMQGIPECWFTALTSLLATAIQNSHEARISAQNRAPVLAIQVQNHLESIFPAIQAVLAYWSNAEAILHLYKDLLVQLKKQAQTWANPQPTCSGQTESNQTEENVPQHDDPNAMANGDEIMSLGSAGAFDADWQALFGAGSPYQFPDIKLANMDEWLCPNAT
ncbi:MAG: hypothetical protein DI539_14155 [Flavobacterium psychrophilum]|nr:MAG: hypothetical protein DI539_14155 [Flavobacterium psychrophilum]